MELHLVGRETELASLAGIVSTLRREHRPAVAFVVGEPGSGKTRLLAEARSIDPTLRTVAVAGHEPEVGLPYAAISHVPRSLPGPDALRWRELMHAGGGELLALRVAEAAHRALTSRPTLLLVDDLQWVDPASTAVLHYLVRGSLAPSRALAVVVAARPERAAIATGDSMLGLVGEHGVRVDLGPLDPQAARDLVRQVTGNPDRAFGDSLHERAAGSPFWLVALARDGGRGAGSLVASRMRCASADAAELLAVLAVVARPMSASDLQPLLEWPPDRLVTALDELTGSGLAARHGDQVQTVHDLVREKVVEQLPAARRRELHVRIAAAAAAAAGDDVHRLLVALHHTRAAGAPAADVTRRVLASAALGTIGEAGLAELLGAVTADPDLDPRGHHLERVARTAETHGHRDLSLAAWSALAERASGPARGRACVGAARACFHLGDADGAQRWIDAFHSEDDHDEELVLMVRSIEVEVLRWLRLDMEAARRRSAPLLADARAFAVRHRRSGTLRGDARDAYREVLATAISHSLADLDEPAILPLAEELVEVAAGTSPPERLRAEFERAAALRLDPRTRRSSIEPMRTVYDAAVEQVMPLLQLEAGFGLSAVLHDTGDLDTARMVLASCAALEERIRRPGRRTPPMRRVAMLVSRAVDSDWRRAAADLETAAATETDPHFALSDLQMVAFWTSRLDPEHGAARVRHLVERAEEIATDAACWRCSYDLALDAAEALARVGDTDGGRARLLAAASMPGRGKSVYAWRHERAEMVVAVAEGAGDAEDRCRRHLATVDGHGFVVEGIWARIDLARVLAPTDPHRAVAVLTEAATSARACGDVTDQLVAEQALRHLGVHTWRRPAAPAGSLRLTDREREVAALVASGSSNPEIANRLFLSRKTIERHVSAILHKVGARNRTELASRWEELRDLR